MTTLQLFTETWSQAVFAQGFADLLQLVGLALLAKPLPASKHHKWSREQV